MIKKLLFLVDKLPYKAENSRLALTHAIASQTVEIHLEDEDNVEPVLAFVGEGVLNCIKGQKSLDAYGITSLEGHIKNALLLDLKVMVCKEDLKKFGLTEDSIIMDAEDIGGDMLTNVLPFADILNEMEVADHILHF